ncbi:MAG: EAL domain-containing protein [Clostridia bacterium]|nr:EAL domain-containing protein [Clostridia bacterium]
MKRSVLVVEDNDINRAILSEILSDSYIVYEAENGAVALDVLRREKNRISIILLDVQMPVMDGYTFLDIVKADKELSPVPVIVMTQGNSEADELAALEHGATDFLSKPYRPKIIMHRVAGLIKLRETATMINQIQNDRMTGLYTKEYFYELVCEQLLRNPEKNYTIVCSNIENFKIYNDIFGVAKGDELLKKVADVTRSFIGNDGFCGRLSADRFLVFQNSEKEEIDREKLSASIESNSIDLLKSVPMRWGIYQITDRNLTVEQMCDRAMMAVDSIKGKYNKYFAVYDDSLRNKTLREQAITGAMESALKEEQFVVYYQPKYSLRTNRLAGAEALVRWIHPEWGFMSPGEFIPLFEQNGFIPKLDQYVREKVCEQMHRWKQNNIPLVPVSVNISRADMFHEDLVESITNLASHYDIDPRLLHLEITESAYADNLTQIDTTVKKLRELGFVIEMDDFGSGYSSLNMLSTTPMDILKLDMKFTQNEIAKPEKHSFLKNIIGMAHQVDMSVVAEGVETKEQSERLLSAGCDYAQGYYLAKPMPAADFEQLLKTADEDR